MQPLPGRSHAAALAERLLAPLGERWLHTRAVAARAAELVPAVAAGDGELLVVAAWWHDLGYSTEVAGTGFHPLDGARYLAAQGYPERLCALVAHHSAAVVEAQERVLSGELAAWPREQGPVADALWTADMTTGPAGQSFAYAERLSEILGRYDADSIVGRAMRRASPAIEAAISRTTERLVS